MQIIGAACGVLGIVVGKVAFFYFGFDEAMVAEIMEMENVSLEAAERVWEAAVAEMGDEYGLGMYLRESFSPIDLLFYGICIYQGWRFPREQSSHADRVQRAFFDKDS